MTWREIEAERADVSNWKDCLVFCLLSFWLPSKNTHRKITLQTSATLNGTEWSLFFGSIGRRLWSGHPVYRPRVPQQSSYRSKTSRRPPDNTATIFWESLEPTATVKFRNCCTNKLAEKKGIDRIDLCYLRWLAFFLQEHGFLAPWQLLWLSGMGTMEPHV